TIVDDVPQAVADTRSTAEDTAVTYNVIVNGDGTSDLQGADAPAMLTAATLATAGAGTVGFLANGNITFTPAAGFAGAAVINYTITDQDGDTSSSTLTVTVAADSVPSVSSTSNLTVDEDGFGFAANDAVTARADETASTASLTQSGTAVVNFGNDVPATPSSSIALLDSAALDGQLHTLDGQSVTFALVGGDLVGAGSGGATEVSRLHMVSAVGGPLAGDVTYTYSATLSRPLEHADGLLENSITLTGVTFQATDKDGDPVQGTFNVTIVDDVPQAVADTRSTAEDTAVTYNVITNGDGTSDLQGADAPAMLTAATLATAGAGTVGFLANGNITFTPAAGFAGAAVINYTITDQDGDTSSSTLTVTVAADSVPSVSSTSNLTVDEDGFGFAANDGVAARADECASTASLTQSGTAVVNFGNDVPATPSSSIA